MRKSDTVLALVFALSVIAALMCNMVAANSMATSYADYPMQSAPSAQKEQARAPRNLAIFIFNGVQIIDYTGPFEVFGQARDGKQHLFNVYTVAEKPDAITTNMGMTVVPKYTFDNAPKPDVILLPGGSVGPHLDNPKVIKWVQERANEAEFVMSVCNGAFYLGKAGLLDGKTATTYYGLIEDLRELAPKAKVVTDQRFTDNGKIITTAGLSSGIDGALHLVERIAGRGRAQEIALNMEYNWQPDAGYARASFADRYLRKALGREGFKLPDGVGWTVMGQKGDRNSWEKNWEVRVELSAQDLLKIIDGKLSEGWTKQSTSHANGTSRTLWKFKDEEGKTWSAVSNIQPIADAKNTYTLTIKLVRGDALAQL
ncbi:MAG: DJ-1/PfpI family protein [Pyrinomonadaceae bacterium]|nr:DJ-1/PfpI family protein [Pyrinomonadaceae bacterium]